MRNRATLTAVNNRQSNSIFYVTVNEDDDDDGRDWAEDDRWACQYNTYVGWWYDICKIRDREKEAELTPTYSDSLYE